VAGNCVSRRSLMAWWAAISLSGCAEDESTRVAQDPYLPTMMKDPLYTWRPVGDLSRTEALLPRSTDNLASGTTISRILITFIFRTAGNPESLLRDAQVVSQGAGYVNGERVLMPGVNVSSLIMIAKDRNGVLITLGAPD